MPAEGFVTVVPVEKVGGRTDKKPRDLRKAIGDSWSSRDRSPCTARLAGLTRLARGVSSASTTTLARIKTKDLPLLSTKFWRPSLPNYTSLINSNGLV